MDGDVYVRAANGPQSRWYRAAMAQQAGRVRVDGQDFDVTFESATEADEAVIDSAYEAKYQGSSAVPIMQGSGLRSATVRISRR